MRVYSYANEFTIKRIGLYIKYLWLIFQGVKPREIAKVVLLLFSYFTGLQLPPTTITFRKGNLIFKVSGLLDLVVLKEVLIEECYEKYVQIDRKDKTVVDVGAGLGDFAIATAKAFPHLTVFAIEPDRMYFALLKDNLALNNIINVRAIPMLVTGRFDPFSLGDKKLSSIDFLKIDCEGCEFQLINKLESANFKKIKKISLEYHESSKNKIELIVERLERAGFRVVISPKDIPGLGLLWAKRD